MDSLVFLLFILAGISIWISISEARSQTDSFKPKEKRCPPHKWDYDSTGRIRCQFCGPMSNLGYTARGDDEQ
jgi:hypothetical protein